jgi:hypothetical protein
MLLRYTMTWQGVQQEGFILRKLLSNPFSRIRHLK